MSCTNQDPWLASRSCFRLNVDRHPYGKPSIKDGCPCNRNLIIQKIACGFIAFHDCVVSAMQIKERRFNLSIWRGDKGIYTPVRMRIFPFHLEITLHFPHFIKIEIGKLCRFAKFRIKVVNWTVILKKAYKKSRLM